jgi:hypothetical protein
MQNFEEQLKGGHHNSLGNTVEVVEEILARPDYFDELFNCYFSDDGLVRLRVSNAMKRICKANKDILIPYIDRLIDEISTINQASAQWTLAQLFEMLEKQMTKVQIRDAKEIMKNNLANHNDWIVLNTCMQTLTKWAKKDHDLQIFIRPHLERLSNNDRKSVAGRAVKMLAKLDKYKV